MINIEKGRIGGNFTAEFEPSDRLPKMVSFHSGTKTNVVPGAAEALFVGAADADMNAHAAAKHGEPVDFGERIDEPFSTVLHIGEEARNGKSLL